MNKVTFQNWNNKVQESWLAITILSVFIVAIIYSLIFVDFMPGKSEIITGQLVNFHQIQGKTGSIKSIFIVELKNNSEVRVAPPTHTPIKIHHNVELEKKETESGRVTYEFIRYYSGS
jgi:hypothetical protein